jgi:hypothetical protein
MYYYDILLSIITILYFIEYYRKTILLQKYKNDIELRYHLHELNSIEKINSLKIDINNNISQLYYDINADNNKKYIELYDNLRRSMENIISKLRKEILLSFSDSNVKQEHEIKKLNEIFNQLKDDISKEIHIIEEKLLDNDVILYDVNELKKITKELIFRINTTHYGSYRTFRSYRFAYLHPYDDKKHDYIRDRIEKMSNINFNVIKDDKILLCEDENEAYPLPWY